MQMKAPSLLALLLLTLVLIGLSGCLASGPQKLDKEKLPPLPNNKTDCEATGGSWGLFSGGPEESCFLRTTDAGRPCTNSDQCEGACEADQEGATTGACTKRRPVMGGCHAFVENGPARTLCIE